MKISLRWTILVISIIWGLVACNSQMGTTTLEPTEGPTPTSEPTDTSDEILLVTGEFPPHSGETLEGGGYATEIVRAVFAEMGYPVRIEFYPWARAEAMVENGEAWGTFPYLVNEERQAKFFFSDPFIYYRELFFFYGDKMKNVEYEEFSDLQPYRIGGATGYWYIPVFEEAGLTVDIAPDDLENLNKLKAGRVDLYPLNEAVGWWLIQNNFPDDVGSFGTLEKPSYLGDGRIMVGRSYPGGEALLQEFNAALAKIQANGTYAEIYEKYNIPLVYPVESDGN
jgi:polar amino acid transport system substrate-binding protein